MPHIKTHSNFEMSKTLISGNKNVNNLFKALLLIKYEPISTMKFIIYSDNFFYSLEKRPTLCNLVKVYNLLGEFVGKHIFLYYIISLKPDQGLNHLYIELSHKKKSAIELLNQ